MEESEITLERIKKDLITKKEAIQSDVRAEIPKFEINEDQNDINRAFRGYFNLRLRDLLQVVVKVEADTTFTRPNTFTQAVVEEFDRWNYSLKDSFLPEFFKKAKNELLAKKKNLWDLREIHIHLFQQMGPETGEYADRDLLVNPDLEKLYDIVIESYILKEMFEKAKAMNIEDPKMIDKFLGETSDPFQELRGLENKFNTANVGELINFFSVLRKEVRGQSGPIASDQDIVNLVKSILSNQVKKGSIKPNLVSSDYPALRRLFFDFYIEYKEGDKYHIEPMLRKEDYLKFIEIFEPFVDCTSNENWIKYTTSKNQTTTLKYLTSKMKNPKQPILKK